MQFRVYRDGDARFRLRKVVVELLDTRHHPDLLVDRIRMFAGPRFEKRLNRRMKRMIDRAEIMMAYSKHVS